MFSHVAAASTSQWNGPSSLSGTSQTVSDAFEVPGNATVGYAWLHVDESGYLEDGYGETWTAEDVPGNFTAGQFTNTMVGKFHQAMSLSPNNSFTNVNSFSSNKLQLPTSWSNTGGIWEGINPSGLSGTVSGQTRTLAHGFVPAAASNGSIVAATLPGQGLPPGSNGALISPQYSTPNSILDFNFSFSHWHHLDYNDGAWVEYRLDNGSWIYMTPMGGYPDSISNNSITPQGVNVSNFTVFGSGNHSGWVNSKFSLDNLAGLSNASTIQFRFRVWTDTNSISRPGWYIDEISLTNQANSSGYWHFGCISQTSSYCSYVGNANAAMESPINLSAIGTNSKIKTKLNFDLEGSSYDNFCIELSSDNGSTWVDISSGSSSTTNSNGSWIDCSDRSSPIPGSSYVLPNGTRVYDDSGGFTIIDFQIPSSMISNNSSGKIRYVVDSDSIWGYGSPQDSIEGLTVDWFKLIDSSGNVIDQNFFPSSSSARHYALPGSNDDWSFVQIGSGGLSISEGFESSSFNNSFPSGWTISSQSSGTGWEFGSLCSNFSYGPSSFPSPNLGFGTNLCGNYDSYTDISVVTPNYTIPLGASARFVWKHWMCSEDNYDGGELFVSKNGGSWSKVYVNYTNGSNWYDGQTYSGVDVWDGRQHLAASGAYYCTSSSANIPWIDMEYDVSNYSGNNISFRFRQTSDVSAQDAGWYIDDVGLEVDWFETEGSWKSPLVSTNDLGYGFVDADIILPDNTWYGVNVLDSSGQTIPGHENMSLPLSLASIDRDVHNSVHIEVVMGTDDEYYTPLIKELTIGATRYFGESNGWNIPQSLNRLSNGTWVNDGGSAIILTGESGLSSRPISSATVSGNISGVTTSLTTTGSQSVSTMMSNSVLDLGDMRAYLTPKVTISPGGMIEELAIRGAFAEPASDASIDLAQDNVHDWQFMSSPAYGSFGWQTRIDDTTTKHSMSVDGNGTLSVLVPENANVHTLLLGINPEGPTSPLTVSSGQNTFYQITAYNWTTSVVSISNPQLVSSGTHTDTSGRNWSIIDIDFSSPSSNTFSLGSFAVGYNLFENVSGLGSVVRAYHEANSNNGLADIVDVPLSWNAAKGGVSIDGGVFHQSMITNHPFTVPVTWYPNGLSQGFTTQHQHLLGNENIAEIHLTGIDSSGQSISIVLTNISNNPTFSQTGGLGMLDLQNTSSATEIGNRLVVDWQFEVDWDWDDSQTMSWTVQAYEIINGQLEGLSPATAESGGIAKQASENDLQVDSWQVLDLYGHDLSDFFSPSYPFWAKSSSQVSVSGTVRFEDSLDIRPMQDDFVVAVTVGGADMIMNTTGDGQWTGLVTLPTNYSEVNLTPYVIRAGPASGSNGAGDATVTNPVNILLDSESPWVSNFQVNNGQRLFDADGFTWDPSLPLSLQVTVNDEQALGDSLMMHYWQELVDDINLDGIADYSEYKTMSRSLPEGVAGERTLVFDGIDVSGLDNNARFSVFFTGTDYAGHELIYGGMAGIENDMGTLIIAINEPTEIPTSKLTLDSVNEHLLAGQMHNLTMEISDGNGVDSIDIVTVKLLGADEDTIGVMNWEPRNGDKYTANESQITLHEVIITQGSGDTWYASWHFTLDWDFDESLISEYAVPSIVVYDDDDLNPVVLLSNLADIRWQLDNNLEVLVSNMSDNTPPVSLNSQSHIFVQPGDDLSIDGIVVYQKSDVQLVNLPEQGLEVTIQSMYGNQPLQAYAEVLEGGTWESGLILPSRSLQETNLVLEYYLTGIPLPGVDVTQVETIITVDDKSPVVEFTTVPRDFDNEDLEMMQFAILVFEEGGMQDGGLTVNWAFMRNGLIMESGQSDAIIPYINNADDYWTYFGTIDFTEGIDVSLVDGDELIWWVSAIDKAGNSATGTGLSKIDAMPTQFTVLSFDAAVTNIEIALANGGTPRGNEVVEGTEIGVVVHVRNLGTKPGTVTISLMEDRGDSRSWLAHESINLTLSIGQSLKTTPMIFETYGTGPQNLYVNMTGMDVWIEYSLMPNCYLINNNASCDLSIENDMPRVISQEDLESGFGGTTMIVSILSLLLISAGVAIVILLRREKSHESIFYDEEEWEDDDDQNPPEEDPEPIHTPVNDEVPDIEAASKVLGATDVIDSESNDAQNELSDSDGADSEDNSESESSNEDDGDPWSDVDHASD